MINKSDWKAAHRDLLAKGRQRHEPPDTDELLAWSRGELSEEEAARIRESLLYHPELARALEEPFPSPDAMAESPEALTNDELDEDWGRLQRHLQGTQGPRAEPSSPPPAIVPMIRPRPSRTWQLSTLAASLLAVVFGGLYVQSQMDVRRLGGELRPQADFSRRALLPDTQRAGSGEPILLSADADHFLLSPALIGDRRFPAYRLDLLDLNRPQPEQIWSGTGLRPQEDGTFEIWLPRAFLQPGEYRIELHGLDGDRPERLATYTFKLPTG